MKHNKCILVITLLVVSLAFSLPLYATTRGIKAVSQKGQDLYLYKDYHALVVGVSEYDHWPDLPNATKDAREVEDILKSFDFEVKLLLNPTSRQLSDALKTMAFRLGKVKDRALLFYFAGHGETLELADGTELGYIIPRDSPLKRQDPIGFDDKALSMKDIEILALKVKSKHFLMVFDSCFSGSLFNLVRAAPVDISEKSARPVRQFITSGGAGEQVPDRSTFKIVFLDGIKGDADLNGDGYVTGSELGMHLQDKVVNYTRGGQHPQYGKINNPKLDKGDFIFALKRPAETVRPSEVAPPPPGLGDIGNYDSVIQKRKANKKKWADWQTRMGEDFARAQRYDQSTELSAKEKADVWASFLSSYRAENPYSRTDEDLKKKAEERYSHWKTYKIAKLPPDSKYSPPQIPISPQGLLRSQAKEDISIDDIKGMLIKYGFYDADFNKNGSFANDLVDNDDGTVTDHATGLMWQRLSPVIEYDGHSMMFYPPDKYVEELNRKRFAGYSDWRLPTIEELASLMQPKKVGGFHIAPIFSKVGYFNVVKANERLWSVDTRKNSIHGWIADYQKGIITSSRRVASGGIPMRYGSKVRLPIKAVRSVP
jgi:hypothetical protein